MKIHGVKIVLPCESRNKLAVGRATKLFLVDEDGVEVVELTGCTSFSIPEVGADSLLQATVTLPLYEIVYEEEID